MATALVSSGIGWNLNKSASIFSENLDPEYSRARGSSNSDFPGEKKLAWFWGECWWWMDGLGVGGKCDGSFWCGQNQMQIFITSSFSAPVCIFPGIANPTSLFPIFELWNPLHDFPELLKIRRSTDFEALKLWKGSSWRRARAYFAWIRKEGPPSTTPEWIDGYWGKKTDGSTFKFFPTCPSNNSFRQQMFLQFRKEKQMTKLLC